MPDHRVPLLGDAWRRHEDPATSRDPRIRLLVGQLSTLATGPGPDPAFRADLRAQLVAITPRIVAESVADGATMVEIVPRHQQVATPEPVAATPSRLPFGRILGIAACLMVAFAMLLGGALVASRHALPGQSLYGLKRAAEQFELATDGNNAERADDLLDFAAARAEEARQLIVDDSTGTTQGAATLSPGTVSLVRSTLASGDSDVRDASRLLAQQAVADGSGAPLATMTNWAQTQSKRLQAIMALGAVRDDASLAQRTLASATLLGQAQTRATQLIPKVTCGCMLNARSDSLGLVPCTTCASTSTPTTTPPATHTQTGSTTPRTSTPTSAAAPKNIDPVTSNPVVVEPGAGLPTPSGTRPSGVLPSIPANLPTDPVQTVGNTPPLEVTSCGIKLDLGILKTTIGLCSSPTP